MRKRGSYTLDSGHVHVDIVAIKRIHHTGHTIWNFADDTRVARLLRGAAEAGFYPGMILYLTYWFPSHRRARMVALFMCAIAVSGIFGGPLSGWIMESMQSTNLAMFVLAGVLLVGALLTYKVPAKLVNK